ncbi:MAG: hypothetical protein K0M45_09210 [Candidatus Paracaedibacteraceae bacterium]|nr:hypothetical protein [Candidatus Paracaedibacteraceae bacterium]
MKRIMIITTASVIGLTLQGCSNYQPTYNVSHQTLPALAESLTEQDIGRTIMEAAKERGWTCSQIQPNKLICKLRHHEDDVTIDISFNKKDFSITHITAGKMDAGEDQVHHRYNRWVKLLRNDILNKLETRGNF